MMRHKLDKLEMVRGLAAIYVFAGHFCLARLLPERSAWRLPFQFGQEAVMLFFLVSGFVIYYSTAKHGDQSMGPYLVRRARRIYLIFLLALLLSWASWVAAHPGGNWWPPMGELAGNLCMLQDFSAGKPGVWVAPFRGNFPLWSLSYEWWFYLFFFPLYRYVPHGWQVHGVAMISGLGLMTYHLFPNQISLFLLYFLTWWCGAELGYSYLHGKDPKAASHGYMLLYLAVFNLLLAMPVAWARAHHAALSPGISPVLEWRHFSACFLFILAGLGWKALGWRGFRAIFRCFAWVAPISYGIYVFHYPLAVTSTYLDGIPWPWARWCGYVAITLGAAYLAEIPLQGWINRKTEGLAGKRIATKRLERIPK